MLFFKQMTIETMRYHKQFLTSALILASVSLTSCAEFPGVYKVKVEQGNIITKEMVDKLEVGQTKEQVKFILGSPLIEDTFTEDQWDYAYRIKHDDKYLQTSNLVVTFKDGLLESFDAENIQNIKR